MIIQFCGLSGSGKSTLAKATAAVLQKQGVAVEVIDGDEYRDSLCKGLGFSKKDRIENMRRMAFVAYQLSKHGVVAIICSINPYKEMRDQVKQTYPGVGTAHIDCSIATLTKRDTKGLYKKALLPKNDPAYLANLTGINDVFDIPPDPDIYINTDTTSIHNGVNKILLYIQQQLKDVTQQRFITLAQTG